MRLSVYSRVAWWDDRTNRKTTEPGHRTDRSSRDGRFRGTCSPFGELGVGGQIPVTSVVEMLVTKYRVIYGLRTVFYPRKNGAKKYGLCMGTS